MISQPSSSPESPSAEFFSNVQQIYFLRQINKITIKEAEEIAIKMFNILSKVEDHKVLSGQIDYKNSKQDATTKNHIRIINGLFKIANDSEIGAIKHLSRSTVEDFDITTAALANCVGGSELLDVLCDIANEELLARRPTFSPIKLEAKIAFK